MPENKNIPQPSPPSRRRFIGHGLKLAGLAALLLPLQKAFGNGVSAINKIRNSQRKKFFLDKLVLNTKTKTVHLPTAKVFTNYDDIAAKHQKTIDLATWESVVKPPVHFCKDKSGIILEVLALQKLAAGITDKNLSAASNTVAVAFTPAYKNADGRLINKYNFRLHELLATFIGLNNSIPATEKWSKFQVATAKQDYTKNEKGFPGYMEWIKTKTGFDKRVAYIAENKTDYTSRLKKRVADYKL